MTISKSDTAKMKRLVQEGKSVADIWRQDFPQHEYWDVYWAIRGTGEQSARGIKLMITNRLNKLIACRPAERRGLVNELQGLVWHLYENHRTSQKKFAQIRKVLGE